MSGTNCGLKWSSGEERYVVAFRNQVDVRCGKEHFKLCGVKYVVTSAAFSHENVALGLHNGAVHVYRVATGELVSKLIGKDKVWSVTFSPDGSLVASGSHDTTVRVWRVANGELVHELRGHNNFVEAVAFSPDGTTVEWFGRRDGVCVARRGWHAGSQAA